MKIDELVDLVDADGVEQMYGITRAEVKRRKEELVAAGLYQPVVIVIVLTHGGAVLAHERGASKGDDGAGEIDHVCGVISSGETWHQAAVREAAEELGVRLRYVRRIAAGVNSYQRYRTLVLACAEGEPSIVHPDEVAAILSCTPVELRRLAQHGKRFVRQFFDDLDDALASLEAQPWI